MDEKLLVILAGAPRVHELSWDEDTLNMNLQNPIKRFLGEQEVTTSPQLSQLSTIDQLPRWRSVTFDLPELTMQDDADEGVQHVARFLYYEDDTSLTNASATLASSDDNTLLSSTSSIATTSFNATTNTSFSASSASKLAMTLVPEFDLAKEVTDLKQIPNAEFIAGINPQTVTVNVLAAVILIAPVRTVKLRKRPGNEMDIVELLLGDETRAGFTVSFWLVPAESQQEPPDDLRETLKTLKLGDIVFIQHVALYVWKDCVYGQSLSRKFTRNSTSLDVVNNGLNLPTATRAKVDRIQGWKDNFLGSRSKRSKTLVSDGEYELPPDTQSPGKR
ncbi:hypothetical protein M433DRAFT_394644 [Acidomyces richmondensis BFW]|nr:MAG: hypothetical protein FE78DRAFT_202759 [Acidomyces sp. 'richmondensis']KYG48697.1 hypothetical protein M433DRAFT_394644 [Acidomyces richmondensis BFW]